MSRDQDPLIPEERALAKALARAAPRGGPSPRVDAAILAGARAAVMTKAGPGARRPRRRWPITLGAVASLMFAVGIAWQLRPAPEQTLPAAEPAQSAPAPAPQARAMRAEPAETAIGRSRVRQQTEAPPSLTRMLDESATVAGPASAPASAAASDDGGIVFDRQDLHDIPPATVDSPGFHSAWLERIRELRESGQMEAARESLREYLRRHPGQPLPDDLDGLLDE